MTRRRNPSATVFVGTAAAAIAALLASCGGGDGAPSCGPVVREQLDPQSFIHLLEPDEVDYLTDPPTSGPHLPGVALSGVSASALDPAVQVSLLEQGMVLVQHTGLGAGAVDELESLAGPDVVVAPNPDLPSPVVATAWLTKQRCRAVDTDALATFVAENLAPDRTPHGDGDEPVG